MTPEQAKLVADSFTQLEARLPELGAAVYDRFFNIAPETRAMFKGDMAAQHRKLVNVLVEFVKLRRRSKHFLPVTAHGGVAVVPGINHMRSSHAAAGVKIEHYDLMKRAILSSVAAMLGESFDARAGEAWGAAFDTLAETMQKPETATPEEVRLLSTMFGRRLEQSSSQPANVDEFFEKK